MTEEKKISMAEELELTKTNLKDLLYQAKGIDKDRMRTQQNLVQLQIENERLLGNIDELKTSLQIANNTLIEVSKIHKTSQNIDLSNIPEVTLISDQDVQEATPES